MAAKKKTKKKAAKKKTTRKATGRKKAAVKKKTKKKAKSTLLGKELPKSLAAFSKQLKRDLNKLEKQIEIAGKGAGRSLAKVMRDASHRLGVLETRGQKEWRSLSRKAEKEVRSLRRRVRKATGVG